MRPSLGGPDHELNCVREHQRADPIVVAGGGQRQYRRDLDGKTRFGVGTTHMQRPRLIDDQKKRQLPLFHIRLHKRVTHARRDVPIDGAKIIAMLVGAHLGKLDPLSAEHGAVVAREQRIDERTGPELDPFDLPQDVGSNRPAASPGRGCARTAALFACVLHGTRTASRILAMTRSESMSSASASNVNRTRCRKHIERHRLHVFRHHVGAPAQVRVRARAWASVDRCARRCAELDQRLELRQPDGLRLTRGAHDVDDVVHDLLVHEQLGDRAARREDLPRRPPPAVPQSGVRPPCGATISFSASRVG